MSHWSSTAEEIVDAVCSALLRHKLTQVAM